MVTMCFFYFRDWSVVFIVLPILMTKLVVAQYILLASLLKQRFALINTCLMNAFGFSDIADEDMSVFEMSSVSTSRGMITVKRFMKNEDRLLEILDMLQETHSALSELIEDINSVYAMSNITIVLEVLVACTRNVYGIIHVIFGGNTSSAYVSLTLLVPGVLLGLTNIFVFAVVCDKASVVARRPVVLVETLKLNLGADQQKVVERLNLFAHHIRNMRCSFTAYSLVTFDYSLLGDFISTVVMYIIILLQFTVSNKSASTRPTSQTLQNSSSS